MTDILSLAAAKSLVRASYGTPQTNQNAATTCAGTVFLAGNGKVEVLATILPSLSQKGKVQAELACAVEGCTKTHIREQSDWHQSVNCRDHALSTKAKLTTEEKAARELARALATVARLTAPAATPTEG